MRREDDVIAIISEEFPQETIQSISEMSSGHAHNTYRVELCEKAIVIKIDGLNDLNDQQEISWSEQFRIEPYILDKVQQKTSIAVPEVIARNESKSVISDYYFVMKELKGYSPTERADNPSFTELNNNLRKKIIFQLGSKIGSLGDIRFQAFGKVREIDGELTVVQEKPWAELFIEITEFWIDKAKGSEFDEVLEEIEGTLEEEIEVLNKADSPVLVHREIDAKNILINDEGLTGILDWEGSISGHKELDLAITEFKFIISNFEENETREDLRETLYRGFERVQELEEGFERRRWIYLLYPAILQMQFNLDKSEKIRKRTKNILNNINN